MIFVYFYNLGNWLVWIERFKSLIIDGVIVWVEILRSFVLIFLRLIVLFVFNDKSCLSIKDWFNLVNLNWKSGCFEMEFKFKMEVCILFVRIWLMEVKKLFIEEVMDWDVICWILLEIIYWIFFKDEFWLYVLFIVFYIFFELFLVFLIRL